MRRVAENASPYPCDIMYRGPTAMSEPEVQNIANFLLDRTDCVRFYVSLHSYTQFWFTRWSFADVLPPDHLELVPDFFGQFKKNQVFFLSKTCPQVLTFL